MRGTSTFALGTAADVLGWLAEEFATRTGAGALLSVTISSTEVMIGAATDTAGTLRRGGARCVIAIDRGGAGGVPVRRGGVKPIGRAVGVNPSGRVPVGNGGSGVFGPDFISQDINAMIASTSSSMPVAR